MRTHDTPNGLQEVVGSALQLGPMDDVCGFAHGLQSVLMQLKERARLGHTGVRDTARLRENRMHGGRQSWYNRHSDSPSRVSLRMVRLSLPASVAAVPWRHQATATQASLSGISPGSSDRPSR